VNRAVSFCPGDGHRVHKKSASTERKYVVDIAGELPVILMQIEPASGNVMKTCIYGNSEALAQHNGPHTAAKYFYLHDRLGSVRQIIKKLRAYPNNWVVMRLSEKPEAKTAGQKRSEAWFVPR
jgi:hypothetical protein